MSSSICKDIKELTQLAQQACQLFLNECKKAGVDIFITETYRSQGRQNTLYEQGRTAPGQIVTWTKNSRHTSRCAWDIACRGNVMYDVVVLEKAGKIAGALGIEWGGIWQTPDRPHFEITSRWNNAKAINVPKPEEETKPKEDGKIVVDGKEIIVDRILKDGVNYIKIRDLADALGYNISSKGDIAVLSKK